MMSDVIFHVSEATGYPGDLKVFSLTELGFRRLNAQSTVGHTQKKARVPPRCDSGS